MNCPIVPWKNAAAIGGALIINIVNTKPKPPCCRAMLLPPSLLPPMKLVTQNDAATAVTTSKAIPTMTLNTANENMVPMP